MTSVELRPGAVLQHFGQGSPAPITRLDLDVTLDGKPEVLLTDAALWEKSGSWWYMYQPVERGFRFLGRIRLHEKLIFLDRGERSLVVWEPIQINRLRLAVYDLTPDGPQLKGKREWAESDPAIESQLASIREFAASAEFPLSWASFDEVRDARRGEAPRWINLRTGEEAQDLRRIFRLPESVP
ncbi:MAG: hypothetical protein AAGA81_00475 [Acidobacteriota bacterium]